MSPLKMASMFMAASAPASGNLRKKSGGRVKEFERV
jgi:hypothetical protein